MVATFAALVGTTIAQGQAQDSHNLLPLAKLDVLETIIQEAVAQKIDVRREETVVWFAKEFLKFAD